MLASTIRPICWIARPRRGAGRRRPGRLGRARRARRRRRRRRRRPPGRRRRRRRGRQGWWRSGASRRGMAGHATASKGVRSGTRSVQARAASPICETKDGHARRARARTSSPPYETSPRSFSRSSPRSLALAVPAGRPRRRSPASTSPARPTSDRVSRGARPPAPRPSASSRSWKDFEPNAPRRVPVQRGQPRQHDQDLRRRDQAAQRRRRQAAVRRHRGARRGPTARADVNVPPTNPADFGDFLKRFAAHNKARRHGRRLRGLERARREPRSGTRRPDAGQVHRAAEGGLRGHQGRRPGAPTVVAGPMTGNNYAWLEQPLRRRRAAAPSTSSPCTPTRRAWTAARTRSTARTACWRATRSSATAPCTTRWPPTATATSRSG